MTKGLSAYCAPGVMPRAVLEGGMAPGVLATPREVEDAIGPGLCRGRRGLVHAAGCLKCPWRASRLGLSPKSAGLQTPALVPWRGRTQPHCSTLGGRGALGLPGACVFSSGIYGALTVCLTVLDVGEGANDTHNLSATYGLTGRVQTSWGQGGAPRVPNQTENQNQQESFRSPWPARLPEPTSRGEGAGAPD